MINPINQLYPEAMQRIQQLSQGATIHKPETEDESFSSILKDSLMTLENKQTESASAARSLIDGSADDLHTVMIKTTEAQLSLEVAVQLRNRALEAYNEIKNMQF